MLRQRLFRYLEPRDAKGDDIRNFVGADGFVQSQKQAIDLAQAATAPFSRFIRKNQDPPANSTSPGYHSRSSMISIIIPTLDEEKVIGRTLSLLKSQLTIPHEIIVSDGASKDKTVEIAKKLA